MLNNYQPHRSCDGSSREGYFMDVVAPNVLFQNF
jgi:hypothetical protein